ncbi:MULTISPECIES: DUF2829 domain-containing protein [Latilactobacillus]|nr:DUF2829 domain-containing protein [Latilactobacillus curvatus]ANJ68912.1 hypothetical protein FBA2_02500 [Latilactobacillus curvatus]AOO75935.1 hypothetical protein LCW_07655 [Latilactobacillus curvatus]ASN60588.1 DUF2829 domain-containing protein [Latilactobacillus curvatus]ASN62542.1 DUF2829 domain-containing protein [Latilactobacillus curvatus]AWV73438.1 DUF2829 domain-containing protein [Latilactobacillus curvatus]
MGFDEAINAIKAGKKVVRTGWDGPELFIFQVADGTFEGQAISPYLLIKTTETPAYSMFQPTSCDVLADDWQLVD